LKLSLLQFVYLVAHILYEITSAELGNTKDDYRHFFHWSNMPMIVFDSQGITASQSVVM